VRTFRLALRLAVAGGREPLLRHAVTTAGVAIGVMLLLLVLCGQSAIQGRAERSGWQSVRPTTEATAPDSALFISVRDYHEGRSMTRAYVAALGPRPPVPPGLDHLPAPGEVAASPALRRLLESTPHDELADRYPGRVTATIGDAGLASPDEYVAIIGQTPEQLHEVDSQELYSVRGFGSLPGGYAFLAGVRGALAMGAALLLVPVVVFIVMATRVAAAQREQRLGAIRLVGATRLQAGVIGAAETALAAAAGSLLGWVGYEVGRRALAATVTFEGGHFHADDVVVAPWLLAAVVVGVPVLAVLTTVVSLARTRLVAPGASPRARRAPPTARRAVPLAVGLGGQLALTPLRGTVDDDTLDSLSGWFTAFAVVGVVAIGPWVCLLAGRALAGASRRLPSLLAARRIAGDPRATFRAVSGVALAAFAVTYSASLADGAIGDEPSALGGTGELRPGVLEVNTGVVVEGAVAPLLARGAVATRSELGSGRELVASCRDLARVTTIGCGSSADVDGILESDAPLDGRPVARVFVPTDGTTAAMNRARTEAANLVPNALIHAPGDPVNVDDRRFFASAGRLLGLLWYFVLVVAACSLTVGMVASLVERRRPFALLRASGLHLGELRRVVLLETGATMLFTAGVGVALGLAASYASARFGDTDWSWPGADVLGLVAVGVGASLLLAAATLPLLDVATRHDAVRHE
jgi:hypothetical protein